ncbi:UNVERIFIED_CONTAM: hypothetical protein GTU68_043064 [Idotea baltica]|nr:hypothetical protein [Idotea baltica]
MRPCLSDTPRSPSPRSTPSRNNSCPANLASGRSQPSWRSAMASSSSHSPALWVNAISPNWYRRSRSSTWTKSAKRSRLTPTITSTANTATTSSSATIYT